MKNEAVAIDINLVPQDPFFQTQLGKALQWALSAGRYIVMFTELIVVLSFATRFYLDRQVTDLNQTIFQKQSVVESYDSFEQEFRDIQTKIEQYRQIEQTENIVEVFPVLSEVIPDGVELTELSIFPASVSLSGTVLSQRALTLLINNLQLSPYFTNVVVNTIESQGTTSSGFIFRLSAQTKATN
jgi:Tfp pilus assembly protein PilN